MKLVVAVILLISAASASQCPNGPITFAGSPSAQRLASAWKEAYATECPAADIIVEAGGSGVGAARVCGTRANAAAVDIGGMTRTFRYSEATTENDWQFQCERSTRKVIQVSAILHNVSWKRA